MPLTLGQRFQATFTAVPTDAAGTPGAFDTAQRPVTITLGTPGVVTLTVNPDGLTGLLVALPLADPAAPQSTTITCEGDADLGAGVQPVSFSDTIMVTAAGQVTGGNFGFGPITPQP